MVSGVLGPSWESHSQVSFILLRFLVGFPWVQVPFANLTSWHGKQQIWIDLKESTIGGPCHSCFKLQGMQHRIRWSGSKKILMTSASPACDAKVAKIVAASVRTLNCDRLDPQDKHVHRYYIYDIIWYMILSDIIWYYMILYDIIWYYMNLYDIIWHYMILYDIIWYYMALYGIIWYYMILYDIIWYYMTLYDIIWYFLILYDII